MKRSWVPLALTAAALLVLVTAASESTNVPAQGPGELLRREVKSIQFSSPWVASCSDTLCSSPIITAPAIVAPGSVDRIDLTVTLSFDYRTSEGTGVVAVTWTAGDKQGTMEPGEYPIASRRADGTSTTLVFARHDVPGAGQEYTFTVNISSRGFPSMVTGSHMVAVVEMSAV